MNHGQPSQQLASQQGVPCGSPKLPNPHPQPQRDHPQRLPQITPQLLTNPYLSPYGFPLLYNNPTVNATVLAAQAQLQAAAVAAVTGGRPLPFLKTGQPAALDGKELQFLQHQALYTALYGGKMPEGGVDYTALFSPEAMRPATDSPRPTSRPLSPKREKIEPDLLRNPRERNPSPKEVLSKKMPHSSAYPLIAQTNAAPSYSSSQQATPHSANQVPSQYHHLSEQESLLRGRFKEESWKAKYIRRKTEAAVEDTDRQDKLPNKPWPLDTRMAHNITHTPLGMIDPATYLATHGAYFIRDEATRQNGLLETNLRESIRSPNNHTTSQDPQTSTNTYVTSSPVGGAKGPWSSSSHKVKMERSRSPDKSLTTSAQNSLGWPSSSTASQGDSSVFNIHSLKYSPHSPASSKSSGVPPGVSKSVVVKTSTTSSGRDGQSVKYISDSLLHRPRTSSPEKLGPMMADGSRARVLSPASLRNLYRFPVPSRPTATDDNHLAANKTIISTGDYIVTQVLGGKYSTSGTSQSIPSHLVYAKHTSMSDSKVTDASSQDEVGKVVRKRTVKEDNSGIGRKLRVKSPPTAGFQSPSVVKTHIPTPETLVAQQRVSNLQEVASTSDPHLRGLMGAGVFDLSGSNITWGDTSRIGREYPGAPTKIALKNALMGVKQESGLNLCIEKPSITQPPQPPNEHLFSSATTTLKSVSSSSGKVECNPIIASSQADPVNTSSNFHPSGELPRVEASSGVSTSLSVEPATKAVSLDKPGDNVDNGAPASNCTLKSDVEFPPKSSVCPNLKKAWIKRSYASDDVTKSTKQHSAEIHVSTTSGIPEEDPNSPGPLKKTKKKQFNDGTKKKRKHKEERKTKKPEPSGGLSSPTSGGAEGDKQPKKLSSCLSSNTSNSKLYLVGMFPDTTRSGTEDGSDVDEEDGKKAKKSKKSKEGAAMPLGENGLPVSVLLCRKEQARLKKSGRPFTQDAACHEIAGMSGFSIQTSTNGASSLPKCRECRSAKRKENSAIFCRFYGFRKLVFVNGNLQAAGFCDPEDSHVTDLDLWLPTPHKRSVESQRPIMELETCRYIMKHIGGKFCELVQEEREALAAAEKTERVSWKRPVHGVREMCDACETTLFNLHWVCKKCGFGICGGCHRAREGMSTEEMEAYDNDRDNLYRWLKCGKGKPHHPSHLIPTQIIPSTCLFDLCELAHEVRAKWNITSQCRCKKSVSVTSSLITSTLSDPTPLLKSHCNNELLTHGAGNPPSKSEPKSTINRDSNRLKGFDCDNSSSPLDWLASIALREQRKNSLPSVNSDDKNAKATSQGKNNVSARPSSSAAPRSWLCNGQLLQLTDSSSSVNVDTFQLHWFYGMPVMASGASENLNRDLWKPETFSAEHGDQPTGAALINCRKGSIITNALIRDFWNGFEKIENRLRDERTGEKLILKLKDWPTSDDFIDTMPEKFDDLMRALPLPQYTSRDGKFNMAAHLPDFFVKPDLGPKMYIAYGWVTENDWNQGTTNLHLDISDACNLMVYVGIPEDEPPQAIDNLMKIIKEGDVDDAQAERTRTLKPGALWHIFKAADTDKIRELILKVKAEMGVDVSEDHDPIHDQQIYLDQPLRRRLKEDYGVEAYPLVQCEGDSVFIPAGAPHQVFNLHSCIKIAEDFVSPEHVDKCFKLTEEFRHLSTAHSNHEDKLQLKNIIYHTMKEVVAAFSWHQSIAAKLDSQT